MRLAPQLATHMKTGSGTRKVMFASNGPMISPAKALKNIASLGWARKRQSATWEEMLGGSLHAGGRCAVGCPLAPRSRNPLRSVTLLR